MEDAAFWITWFYVEVSYLTYSLADLMLYVHLSHVTHYNSDSGL